MASIKDLKKRISSTKNTQQTTKAMKMVSAAKLRRATDAILSQRPYALEIAKLMSILAGQGVGVNEANGGAKKAVSLLVVFSSDRGLCGGYNGSVIRAGAQFIATKTAAGKSVKTVFVGKKANELLRLRAKVDSVHSSKCLVQMLFSRKRLCSRNKFCLCLSQARWMKLFSSTTSS
jgi:F-type H+-transporting ATPase subunit gamma